MSSIPIHTDAEAHFHTSSIYKVPDGHTAWVIRNDYPGPRVAAQGGGVITAPGQLPPGMDPTPWLHVDFKTNPIEYMQLVKEYFLEGMIESDFVPQNNQVCFFSNCDIHATMTMRTDCVGETMVSRFVDALWRQRPRANPRTFQTGHYSAL
jgi:hypothetical protein